MGPIILAVITFIGIECAFISMQNDIQAGFLPALIAAGAAFALAKYVSYQINYAIDHPAPTYYKMLPIRVWEQVSKALKTTKYKGKGWKFNYEAKNPLPGQPITVMAQFDFFHSDYKELGDMISEDDLKSFLYVDIEIKYVNEMSELKLTWRPEPTLSRMEHNMIIQDTTNCMHDLLRKQEQYFNQPHS
ncbi:MAG: hypothetical protein K2X29_14350 [Candidatus Obscuribacterales bacterium]|nr:hypothetical protein [Candidatus Obscuribacterales bacterium]